MSWTVDRARYAELYGPTVGDRVRLADTDLLIEVTRWAWTPLEGPGAVLLAVGSPAAVAAVLDAAVLDAAVLDAAVLDAAVPGAGAGRGPPAARGRSGVAPLRPGGSRATPAATGTDAVPAVAT